MFKNIKPKNTNKKGFTLVEMLVSVGIFSVIMVISVGSLLIVLDSFQKTRLLRNTMENISVSMESITKKIRTGKDYSCYTTVWKDNCKTDSGEAGTAIGFIAQDNKYYVYKWDNTNKKILVCKSNDTSTSNPCRNLTSGDFVSVTSPEIEVTHMSFYVTGVKDIKKQDRVSITLSGFANLPNKKDFDTHFDIQTTVSKRVLDVF